MINANSVFGQLKDNLYTIVVPLIVAAFLWTAVGVLDQECTPSKDSKTVKFVKTAHIVMGMLMTAYAILMVLKLHPMGKSMIKFI